MKPASAEIPEQSWNFFIYLLAYKLRCMWLPHSFSFEHPQTWLTWDSLYWVISSLWQLVTKMDLFTELLWLVLYCYKCQFRLKSSNCKFRLKPLLLWHILVWWKWKRAIGHHSESYSKVVGWRSRVRQQQHINLPPPPTLPHPPSLVPVLSESETIW